MGGAPDTVCTCLDLLALSRTKNTAKEADREAVAMVMSNTSSMLPACTKVVRLNQMCVA